MDRVVDILVETRDPARLDDTIQQLPGCTAVVVGKPDYKLVDGHWVIRCFQGEAFLRFALEHQGYARIIRTLDELS